MYLMEKFLKLFEAHLKHEEIVNVKLSAMEF